jgi:hypothetical protein
MRVVTERTVVMVVTVVAEVTEVIVLTANLTKFAH